MVAANQGHIINMGSTAGIYAYAGAAVHSATKAAVKTFQMDCELIPSQWIIKVTTIQPPGIVETDFSRVRFTVIKRGRRRSIRELRPASSDTIRLFM